MKTAILFLSVFLTTSLFGQNVYIPDANFKNYLVGNPEINTNGDTEIQVSEASSYEGHITCNCLISDITGIEAFTALTELNLLYNYLTNVDVSQNTALITLNLRDNELTSIDVSQNTALELLSVAHNQQISSIDVSQNPALKFLDITDNQISSLDISNNLSLRELYCSGNQLTSLDVSEHDSLYNLSCSYNQLSCLNVRNGHNVDTWSGNFFYLFAEENPNLTCIEVDSVAWSNIYWAPHIDPQTSFSEDCNNDCSNTSSLTELTNSKNLIQILDVMGRETSFKPNTPLIYVYDDGSIEKVFSVEY